MKQAARRHRMVLAGGDGALRQELAGSLVGHDVIWLDPRDGCGDGAGSGGDIRIGVRADLADESLGLSPETYDDLARWATVAVNLVSLSEPAHRARAGADVDGARNLARFAERADALLLHVSAAVADPAATGPGLGATRQDRRPSSAARAEGVVRAASCRSTIVRPCVPTGDVPSGDQIGDQARLVARAVVALLDGVAVDRTV